MHISHEVDGVLNHFGKQVQRRKVAFYTVAGVDTQSRHVHAPTVTRARDAGNGRCSRSGAFRVGCATATSRSKACCDDVERLVTSSGARWFTHARLRSRAFRNRTLRDAGSARRFVALSTRPRMNSSVVSLALKLRTTIRECFLRCSTVDLAVSSSSICRYSRPGSASQNPIAGAAGATRSAGTLPSAARTLPRRMPRTRMGPSCCGT